VRVALENAVSVARVLLLTEVTLKEIPEEKRDRVRAAGVPEEQSNDMAMSQQTFREAEEIMTEFQMTLTTEERQYLLDLLNETMKNMRVEEHRTRTPTYREHVVHQEAIAQGLLNKLLQKPG